MDVRLKCEECEMTFASVVARHYHVKSIHKKSRPNCIVCGKSFRDVFNLKKHVQSMHEKESARENFKLCPVCDCKIEQKCAPEHFQGHGFIMETETLKFTDVATFEEWKTKVEKETNSKFVKHRSQRTVKDMIVNDYYCHRSGYFTSRSQGVRTLKVRGSNKIDGYCPASIVTQSLSSGEVIATFQKTHVGHEKEVGRLCLTKEEKAEFASKIALGVPLEDILDDVGNSIDSSICRRDLTTRKDLHNIIHQFNLNHDGVLHREDYVSVDSWVAHMRDSSNYVRLYKPQGIVLPECPELDQHDFCLILLNDSQVELLRKYGNDVICIDGTHGTNSYNFQLYTLLVLDDLREGFPCSFMICNRGDTVAMQIFFRTVLSALCGEKINPKWIMSDMDDSFYNAWSAVCGPGARQLYCSWHVDRAWRKHVSKIEGDENKIATYKKIKTLMFERDSRTFEIMKEHLRKDLRSQRETQKFAAYFEKFFEQPDRWAYCYRLNAGINTNMALENLHRNLKHIYLKGKKVKRLDKGIHALMRFLNYRMRDRLIAIYRGKLTQKLSLLRSRHKVSLTLSEKRVISVTSVLWNVTSCNNTEFYSVSKNLPTCNCELRCKDCGHCIHAFSCTCADSSILWNMCKHIHLVCRVTKQVETESESSMMSSEATALVQQLSSPARTKTTYVSDLEDRKATLAAKLVETVKSVQSDAGFGALANHVAPLQFIIKSAEEKASVSFPQVSAAVQEPPNKKIIPQRKFYSTKKTPVSKKSKLSNPSHSECDAIALSMVTGLPQD